MSTIVAYAQFTSAKVGKTGLSVSVDCRSINRGTGAVATVVTGATASELIRGIYYYRITSADLQTYDYVAAFYTSDSTVDQLEIPTLWTRFSEAVATDSAGAVAANSIDGQSPPANWSALVIDGSGVVSANVIDVAGLAAQLESPPANWSALVIDGSGVVSANVVDVAGSAAQLESPPANWSALVIDGSGVVSANVIDVAGLAAQLESPPANWGALVIDGAGVVSANVVDVAGSAAQPEVTVPSFILTGVVASSPAMPTAVTFTVTLDASLNVATVSSDFIGLRCRFTSGARFPVPGTITFATIRSGTSVSLAFAAGTFAAAPAPGDTVLISG